MAYTQDSKIDYLMIDFRSLMSELKKHNHMGALVHVEGLFSVANMLEGTNQEHEIQALYDAAFYIMNQAVAIRSAVELLDKD